MATTGHETEGVNIQGLKASLRKTLNQGIKNEGTCSTAAGTAAKTVTLGTTFILEDNATVIVHFTNAVTVANATLAVTHGGTTEAAFPIKYNGVALATGLIKAGAVVMLRLAYNSSTPANSYWDIVGELNRTAPVYDSTNKRITFPASGMFSYDSTNKKITLAQ